MVLSIVVILFVLGVAFFHYIQGFFSATLSAILAIVSAVLALSLQETLIEGPLAGTAPEWMPSITLLLLFASSTSSPHDLRQAHPGNVRMPPLLEKLGGAAMGIVAGIFAVGHLRHRAAADADGHVARRLHALRDRGRAQRAVRRPRRAHAPRQPRPRTPPPSTR
jgi:hypothetical protein